jgi:glycosyltransferase involved in cell wall biosynthesis
MALRVLHRARRVVSVSPYVAEHLRRFMFYSGANEVIPNGMEEGLFALGKRTLRPGAPVTFATVLNGWSRLKNGAVAIQALARLRRLRPTDRLLMFGADHGPGGPAERWARISGIAHGIEFVGTMAHEYLMKRLAEEVDVLVHPSLEEAQPMAVLEAMALGIPVIGGAGIGGVPWTLGDGRAGLLVDVTSASAVAEAMLRLAMNEKSREEWGWRGREHVERHFHIRAVADAYESIYADIMGRA